MKFEIDLNDILGDEYGAETLQESVKRQVIENLSRTIKEDVGRKLDEEVAKMLNDEIRSALAGKMPAIVDEVLQAEYTPVDRYGNRAKPTTFRAEIVRAINEEMVYKKTNYSSDQNAFTKAVDTLVENNVAQFKTEFAKQVDSLYVRETMDYAAKKLAERLGIK